MLIAQSNSEQCNADLGHPCDADNGEPCYSCRKQAEYWLAEYNAYGRREVETAATYEQDMRDAGRGHLLASV